MHRKNIDTNFIYFLVIFLFKCVCAMPPADREFEKILYDDQLNFLSSSICSSLDLKNEDECIMKFNGPPSHIPVPSSPVTFWCHGKDSIVAQVTPSKNWQVVLLVPEPNVGDNDINYALFSPSTEFESISIFSDRNYTFWNTDLVDGEQLSWQGGALIPFYNSSATSAHTNYDIRLETFYTNVMGHLALNGIVRWNVTNESDACFRVINTCKKIQYRTIPRLLPNRKREVLLTNLPLNDHCYVQVTGTYGSTKQEYNTDSCQDVNVCLKETLDKMNPPEVHLSASKAEDNTWTVSIKWTRPTIEPERFHVTLIAENNQTVELAGNATKTVFTETLGTGVYLVTIDSIIGETAARRVEQGFFLEAGSGAGVEGIPREDSEGDAGTGPAAWVACAVALTALCSALAWRHRCPQRREKPPICYPDLEKPPKGIDTEPVVIEVETADDRWEVRSDRLLLHEVIGEGAFGVVRKGTLEPDGKQVAVKMLKEFPTTEEIRSFRSEMELMKSVGVHPHIVSLVGCCSGRKLLIISEYCSQGDLLSYLRSSWDVLVSKHNARYCNNNTHTSEYRNDLFRRKVQTENSKLVVNTLYELQSVCDKELNALDLLSFCRQIAMGMEFLAANRVVHRDLAARNVLVTSNKTLKIADFGLSRDVYEENQYKQTGNGKMPIKWMALESLTRRVYTSQSDVWSYGVVLWEVVTMGASPYPDVPAARLLRLLRAGYRMRRPNNCSKQLYEIMLLCWQTSPRARPTFPELHTKLDELLHEVSTHNYLALQLDGDIDSDTEDRRLHSQSTSRSTHKYFRRFISSKLTWSRNENYERPVMVPQSNHYTSSPMVINRTPPV